MGVYKTNRTQTTSTRTWPIDPKTVRADPFLHGQTLEILHFLHSFYMVIDLKVLVRSFNCESRACYVGNPRESFFRVRESKILFRESFAKVGYYNHYM